MADVESLGLHQCKGLDRAELALQTEPSSSQLLQPWEQPGHQIQGSRPTQEDPATCGSHSQISQRPLPPVSGELCPKQALVQVLKDNSSDCCCCANHSLNGTRRPCCWDLSFSSVRETDLQTADKQRQMSNDDFARCLRLQLLRQLDAKIFCT